MLAIAPSIHLVVSLWSWCQCARRMLLVIIIRGSRHARDECQSITCLLDLSLLPSGILLENALCPACAHSPSSTLPHELDLCQISNATAGLYLYSFWSSDVGHQFDVFWLSAGRCVACEWSGGGTRS